MARRKRENADYGGIIKWTSAIALVAFGLILVPAAFGVSEGVLDTGIFAVLYGIFGITAYLLPFAIIALGVLIMIERTSFPIMPSIGVVIIGLSFLSLVGMGSRELGGTLGGYVSELATDFFGTIGAIILLSAVLTLGLVLTTDIVALLRSLATSLALAKEKLASLPSLSVLTANKETGTGEPGFVSEPEGIPSSSEEPTVTVFNEVKETRGSKAGIIIPNFDAEYTPPPVSLVGQDSGKPGVGDIKANANVIKRTFQNFGISVEMDEVSVGPTVTRYAIKPAEGVRLSKIVSLQNNLELALAAHPVRIEAPIPGKSLVGIEVPNTSKATVGLGGLLSAPEWTKSEKSLLAAIGRDIAGTPHYVNIAKMPHGLVAGATGSGKSVAIHTIITSLLYRNSPNQLRFIMVDPKRVELTLYNGIPHLLTPVITDPKKCILALKWAAKEMDRRYNILEAEQARDIDSYHRSVYEPSRKKGADDAPEAMPFIVVVIDELADIMQSYPRELEAAIVRLAQMSRAVGIHLLLSTQRPSVNVITGLIKANVPTRLALQVASQIDSRTILDQGGAETLLGAGDMLYLSADMQKPVRIQTAYIAEQEVKKVVSFIKQHNAGSLGTLDLGGNGAPAGETADPLFFNGADDDIDDDLYQEAKTAVEEAGRASTSYLQRKLRIGYSRAARIIDLLEEKGVIGPADGARPREVLSRVGAGTSAPSEEF